MIIYRVTNIINNKIYIGQTIRRLLDRRKQHEKSIMHKNPCMIFNRALKKYGINSFLWEIIDTAKTKDELNSKEIFWIKKLDARNLNIGYNIAEGGNFVCNLKDHPNRNEIIKKISKNNVFKRYPWKKKELSKKMRGKLNPMYGKTYQAHGLVNYAKMLKGKKYEDIYTLEESNRRKLLISIANKNKNITPEQRENYRKANIGKKNPMYKIISDEIVDSIVKQYSNTQIANEISDNLKIDIYTVRKCLKEQNLEFKNRKRGETILGSRNNKFIFVHNKIKNIIIYLYTCTMRFTITSILNILNIYNIDLSRYKIINILRGAEVYDKKRTRNTEYLEKVIINDEKLEKMLQRI